MSPLQGNQVFILNRVSINILEETPKQINPMGLKKLPKKIDFLPIHTKNFTHSLNI